jgi:type IV secretory pathway VirB10-like protein
MKILVPLLLLIIFCSTSVSAQMHVLQPEEPVVVKASKLERFEPTMGKHFDLVLEQANTFQPVALVSSDVHDHYGDVTVPRGSRVIGRYVGFQSGRH